MGCDIHMYPEYATVRQPDGKVFWDCVAKRMNPGRDYDLFGKIAGVRAYGENKSMFGDPRGMPTDPAMMTAWDNQLYVTDNPELADNDEWCSRERAESWVAGGSSIWVRDDRSAVSNPDHHSHTWLTAGEFRQLLEAPRPDGWDISAEYWAVLAMLEEIERRGHQTRLVMWFDN